MSEQEQAQAHQEAIEASSRASRSAQRARMWAGMNRYLAAEAAHEKKRETEEKAER
jgi:hypothetical protein